MIVQWQTLNIEGNHWFESWPAKETVFTGENFNLLPYLKLQNYFNLCIHL